MDDLPRNLGVRTFYKLLGDLIRSVGPKPGLKQTLAMVVNASELSKFHMKLFSQRSTRTRLNRSAKNRPDAPKHWKSVCVTRSFIGREGDESDVVVQLQKCASIGAASRSVDNTLQRIIVGPKIDWEVSDARCVEDVHLDGVEHVFAYEFDLKTPSRSSHVMYLSGNLDRVLFTMQFSSWEHFWSWDDVAEVGNVQAEKIRSIQAKQERADYGEQ